MISSGVLAEVYLDAKSVAEILGVKVDTLRCWRYSNRYADRIPAFVHINRRVFYRREDVLRFAESMFTAR
ncbi:helix-turn-helix domain-containing protein [Pseudomonas kurunegalensis]|uniref:helix-turn-helix domain-containing protein n=1 Tax=Pseudomonas kurunegalensis TaxID=485880 RepID=UPI0035589CD4